MSAEYIYKEIEMVSTLLKKYFDGELTSDERSQLAGWLREDRGHREMLMKMREKRDLRLRYERWQGLNVEQDFEELKKRIFEEKSARRFVKRWMYYTAAAVVLVLIGLGAWLQLYSPGEKAVPVSSGKVLAILKTADGNEIKIEDRTGQNKKILGDYFVVEDSLRELSYQDDKSKNEQVRYHQLDVPRGGEYKLKLSDGSVIWLNSESSVYFPEAFGESKREIRVSGEVYLEVAKDATRPFIVNAGAFRTEVFGTSFMMRVYPEEREWSTVLVEGKVKVSFKGTEVVLEPRQKAYVERGVLYEGEADLNRELAWLRGAFVFEHERLENVMRTLSRWYDVSFVFEREELKDYEFTGSVRRDQPITEVLDVFERMNVVTFVKKGNSVLIKEKDKVK